MVFCFFCFFIFFIPFEIGERAAESMRGCEHGPPFISIESMKSLFNQKQDSGGVVHLKNKDKIDLKIKKYAPTESCVLPFSFP